MIYKKNIIAKATLTFKPQQIYTLFNFAAEAASLAEKESSPLLRFIRAAPLAASVQSDRQRNFFNVVS